MIDIFNIMTFLELIHRFDGSFTFKQEYVSDTIKRILAQHGINLFIFF